MTDLSAFTDDELADILAAPRAVMEGAIFADGETSPIAFLKEVTAGSKVFKEAQRHANGFVRSVAQRLRQDAKEPSPDAGLPDPEEAIAKALGTSERASAALAERGSAEDRDAYVDWLLKIATRVTEASSSKKGGFFSRKVAVTDAEQEFLDRLTAAAGR
ncbi:hypothetical protein AB0B28_00780 [Glycomyces sp. NPDC046736]|uniref:hypothetical protein n=1 Tax=Glycomyces sp. NPDC046736 TaxID=3155615 RepID=UPI0033E540AA